MIELLGQKVETAPEPSGDVLFLYDPATSKDLISGQPCIALANGASIDTAVQLDGYNTLKFGGASQQGIITLPTPVNLEALTEWTLEWTSKPTAFGSGYFTEVFMDLAVTQGYPVGCRWSDGGYGNRLQFNINDWSNAVIGQPATTKAAVVNTQVRWAMVYKGGQLRVYKDGAKQMLAFGTSNSYNQDYINKARAFGVIAKMYLGYYNSVNQAWMGNMGRIRLSAFARYLANYTPVPF